jgi:hypothetical protein
MEDTSTFFYEAWRFWPSDMLWQQRYRLGVQLRCTYPRPAYPDYTYSLLCVVNRVLSERGEV